jgi:hypothetical protein
VELSTELLRWRRDSQRARRHDALEYGLPTLGQRQARDLKGDAYEVSIGRRGRFLVPEVFGRSVQREISMSPAAAPAPRSNLRPLRSW